MDKYEELKLLFSKIDDYFDDLKHDDYAERYRAWLKIIFNDENPRAKSEMPKVGVLKPQVNTWLVKNGKKTPLSNIIRVKSGIITAKKAQRHSSKKDALSKQDWADLIEMLKNPMRIFYDNNSQKILYITNSADRLNQLCIEFDYRKAEGDCMLVSAYKTTFANINQRVQRGDLEKIC